MGVPFLTLFESRNYDSTTGNRTVNYTELYTDGTRHHSPPFPLTARTVMGLHFRMRESWYWVAMGGERVGLG